MTEAEWLAATDPQPMLAFLADHSSQRRLHCAVLECCRVLHPICGNELTQRMLRVAEKLNERNEVDAQVESLRFETRDCTATTHNQDACVAYRYLLTDDLSPGMVAFALSSTVFAVKDECQEWSDLRLVPFSPCHLLRCIFGNPFRPVAFDPRWRTETAVALASGIYADRAYDRLPILADALEDAGCDAAELLAHLRGPGPHACGCWAVDAVLGKG